MSTTNLERGIIPFNNEDLDEVVDHTSTMSSIADTDRAPLASTVQTKPVTNEAGSSETNHKLPARTMDEADEEARHDDQKDDAATMAASEELKHTTISDRIHISTEKDLVAAPSEHVAEDKEMEEPSKAHTPEPDTSD